MSGFQAFLIVDGRLERAVGATDEAHERRDGAQVRAPFTEEDVYKRQVKCLAGLDVARPYTIRFLFGANEETSMADVAWYLENYESPAFLFTPDADFPVCYGEKGGYDGCITSAPIADPVILDISGGVVTNAVPGEAWAVVRADAAALPAAERITVEDAGDGTARIDATGVNAHAAWPERGISAIMLLANYLLENGLCNQQEREFLELVQSLVSDTTGAGVGIATADEYFGPLTVVGGTIRKEGDRLVQTMDSRWPTSITAEEITAALTKLTDNIGATFENTLLMVPFLVKPDDPEIQVLQDAFQFVTGDTEHKPFTIGGGTYAREFKKGASFGVNMPWIENPDWVGGEHGPDEGVSEELLKTSFKIYVLALAELQGLKIV